MSALRSGKSKWQNLLLAISLQLLLLPRAQAMGLNPFLTNLRPVDVWYLASQVKDTNQLYFAGQLLGSQSLPRCSRPDIAQAIKFVAPEKINEFGLDLYIYAHYLKPRSELALARELIKLLDGWNRPEYHDVKAQLKKRKSELEKTVKLAMNWRVQRARLHLARTLNLSGENFEKEIKNRIDGGAPCFKADNHEFLAQLKNSFGSR